MNRLVTSDCHNNYKGVNFPAAAQAGFGADTGDVYENICPI